MRSVTRKATFAVEFPLAASSSVWGGLYGTMAVCGNPPSHTMAELPTELQVTWGAVTLVAASVTTFGLFVTGHLLTVARGMTLMAACMLCYGVTIVNAVGWWPGGQAGGLTVAFALGLVARAYRLRVRETNGVRREGG